MKITHRGAARTSPNYKGIPMQAFEECHAQVVALLNCTVEKGRLVLDIGAGNGALTRRILDAGYLSLPVDADCSEWMVEGIECIQADINNISLEGLICADRKLGAICIVEVLEHLDNPRAMICKLSELAKKFSVPVIISTPNPLDTFSCGSLFRRGCFGAFSPAFYEGGGHISILPFWLIDKHFNYAGLNNINWYFVAPYKHNSFIMRAVISVLGSLRAIFAKNDGDKNYREGQCAVALIQCD